MTQPADVQIREDAAMGSAFRRALALLDADGNNGPFIAPHWHGGWRATAVFPGFRWEQDRAVDAVGTTPAEALERLAERLEEDA